jgi:hypothetical protein
MSARDRMPAVLLTIWTVTATLIYFRQLAQPALHYLSRTLAHH